MVVKIIFHVPQKFQIDPRSYVSGVALQSCCDKFTMRRHQNKFLKWSKYNLGELEGRSLKIGKRKHIIKTIKRFGM